MIAPAANGSAQIFPRFRGSWGHLRWRISRSEPSPYHLLLAWSPSSRKLSVTLGRTGLIPLCIRRGAQVEMNQRDRTDSLAAPVQRGSEFRERHPLVICDRVGACAIGEDDMQSALRFSVLCWTPYYFTFSTGGGPERRLERHDANDAKSRDLPQIPPSARVENVRPLSVALAVTEADFE